MKYIYVILIILVLYYLFSNLYQNYSSSEHFDPSLVPVSSIVTLAKVAQKLVDGGGTLTNPGNLNIGIPSAPGNFTVTGNTTLGAPSSSNKVYGATEMTGPTIINGETKINNSLEITSGVLKLSGKEASIGNIQDSDGNARLLFWGPDKSTYYDSGEGNIHHFRGYKGADGTNVNIYGNLKLNAGRAAFPGAKSTPSGSGDGYTHFNHPDGNNYIRGNINIDGGLMVTKTRDVSVYGTGGGQNNKANITTNGISIGRLNDEATGSPMLSSNDTMMIQSQSGTTKFLINSVDIDNDLKVTRDVNIGGKLTTNGDALVNNKLTVYGGIGKYMVNNNDGGFLSYNDDNLVVVSEPNLNSIWHLVPTGKNSCKIIATNGKIIVASGQNGNGDGTAKLEKDTGQQLYVQSWNPLKFGQSGCFSVRYRDGKFSQWANCWGNSAGSDSQWTLI